MMAGKERTRERTEKEGVSGAQSFLSFVDCGLSLSPRPGTAGPLFARRHTRFVRLACVPAAIPAAHYLSSSLIHDQYVLSETQKRSSCGKTKPKEDFGD